MESSPACIFGFNSSSICIENVGNLDIGKDTMTAAQKETIVKLTTLLAIKFNIPINTDRIVYHHWFNLASGERNNGTGGNKSCPGTAFFGGNKVADCQANFLPLVQNAASGILQPAVVFIQEYRIITANKLNVRIEASSDAQKTSDRAAIPLGSVLRVFNEKNGWYKISSSAQHWIYGKYT